MDFKKGSEYTRNEIHSLYFRKPVPRVGSGMWNTGYVQPPGHNDFLVFMNIDVAGKTGHDFPNQYNEEDRIITWYGKPNSNSQQPTFQKLINKELVPHFFARWDTNSPFTYLGIGKILKIEDGHPAKQSNGKDTTCVQVTLTCSDSEQILPSNTPKANFAMEKHLEDFIVENWDSIPLVKDYERYEENDANGKRKQFRTDTGAIDIFALSKDKSHYLVIELKKGRESDKVVGQIQRYMGYIKAEIAKPNQEVKGLIVALEDDLRLQRALIAAPNIDFRRYEISFELIESDDAS